MGKYLWCHFFLKVPLYGFYFKHKEFSLALFLAFSGCVATFDWFIACL